MQCRMKDLRCKEVVNICDGRRLGYVGDVEIRIPEGQVTAVIVYGPPPFFGLFGREPDFLVPLGCITKIGQDIILVDIPGPCGRSRREKKKLY